VALIQTYLRALRLLGPEKGLATLLVLANMTLGLIQLAEPVLFGRVVDALSKARAANDLILLWAGLGLFSIVAGVLVAMAADRLSHRLRLSVLANAFEHVITLPAHQQGESGSTVRLLLAGSDALFWMWLTFLREHLAALISIAFLIPTAVHMQAQLAAILGILALVYTLANVIVVRKSQAGQTAVESHNSGVFGQVGDVIGNITVVQGFERVHLEVTAIKTLMQELLAVQYPVLTWWAVLTVLTRASATLAMVAIFATGSYLSSEGKISLGDIVSFVGFATLLIGKLDQLSSFSVRIFSQMPTIKSFLDLFDNASRSREESQKPELKVSEGRVRFEKVSFQYPGSPQGVFDLDFEVPPGQTVALVGKTGSGKTTTLLLLERLLEMESGRILIDDQNIQDVRLGSLRQAISVVFQDAGLFNRSILENIRIGRPEASEAEIHQAAQEAEAEDFILRKPGGYDFVIGEQGGNLSGGERQRIAIARALLKKAPLLILDEATSALDTWTEARIQRALDALKKGRTTFVIAHRLSTVSHADQIIVLDQGRIIEQGTFDQLVAIQGAFAEMLSEGGFSRPDADQA
jgi:ATP-binding cassette subfamily B protein